MWGTSKHDEFHDNTDLEIVDRYRNSMNTRYPAELFKRYQHLILGLCLKYLKDSEDAKDAAMQIFEVLVEKVHKKPINNFKSWLYVVSKNHCLMWLRKEQTELKKQEEHIAFMEIHRDSHHKGDELMNRDEKVLVEGMAKLPAHQRECLEMFYFENKAYVQISEQTGYELKKVKSYIQNGKRNLKNYLDKQVGE